MSKYRAFEARPQCQSRLPGLYSFDFHQLLTTGPTH
jgi:hypothetical protein